MQIQTIKTVKIEQFHEVIDKDKFQQLVEDMKENGWNGRPLVVIDCCGEYSALTGSHRLAAAREAELYEIPCAVVDHGTMFEDYDITVSDLKCPSYIMAMLEEYDVEAAELYSEDVD